MARLNDKAEEARILRKAFDPNLRAYGRITSAQTPNRHPQPSKDERERILKKAFDPDLRAYGRITCAEAPGRPRTLDRQEPPTPEPPGSFRWWRRKPRT